MGYAVVFGSVIVYGLFFYFVFLGNFISLSVLIFFILIFVLLFGNLFLGEILSWL